MRVDDNHVDVSGDGMLKERRRVRRIEGGRGGLLNQQKLSIIIRNVSG